MIGRKVEVEPDDGRWLTTAQIHEMARELRRAGDDGTNFVLAKTDWMPGRTERVRLLYASAVRPGQPLPPPNIEDDWESWKDWRDELGERPAEIAAEPEVRPPPIWQPPEPEQDEGELEELEPLPEPSGATIEIPAMEAKPPRARALKSPPRHARG